LLKPEPENKPQKIVPDPPKAMFSTEMFRFLNSSSCYPRIQRLTGNTREGNPAVLNAHLSSENGLTFKITQVAGTVIQFGERRTNGNGQIQNEKIDAAGVSDWRNFGSI
jgi:hypothetical protein